MHMHTHIHMHTHTHAHAHTHTDTHAHTHTCAHAHAHTISTVTHFSWEKPEIHVAIISFIDSKETCIVQNKQYFKILTQVNTLL